MATKRDSGTAVKQGADKATKTASGKSAKRPAKTAGQRARTTSTRTRRAATKAGAGTSDKARKSNGTKKLAGATGVGKVAGAARSAPAKASGTKKRATAAKTGERAPSLSRGKDPKGGLNAEGREFYKKTEGLELRPGVKGKADTPEKMVRKGSFLRRHFANPQGPVKDKKGQPTRQALEAAAWGEPVPQNRADERKLAVKGKRLLEQYHLQQDGAKGRGSRKGAGAAVGSKTAGSRKPPAGSKVAAAKKAAGGGTVPTGGKAAAGKRVAKR